MTASAQQKKIKVIADQDNGGPQGYCCHEKDRGKWMEHLTHPVQLHPASVQLEVDFEKFEKIFVDMMSQ